MRKRVTFLDVSARFVGFYKGIKQRVRIFDSHSFLVLNLASLAPVGKLSVTDLKKNSYVGIIKTVKLEIRLCVSNMPESDRLLKKTNRPRINRPKFNEYWKLVEDANIDTILNVFMYMNSLK